MSGRRVLHGITLGLLALTLIGSRCGGDGGPTQVVLEVFCDESGDFTEQLGRCEVILPIASGNVKFYWNNRIAYAEGWDYAYTELDPDGSGEIARPPIDALAQSQNVTFFSTYEQVRPQNPYAWQGPRIITLTALGNFEAGQTLTFPGPPIECVSPPCEPRVRLLPHWLEMFPEGGGNALEYRWFLMFFKTDPEGYCDVEQYPLQQADAFCARSIPGTVTSYPNAIGTKGFDFFPEHNPVARLMRWDGLGCTDAGCHVRGCYDPAQTGPGCEF